MLANQKRYITCILIIVMMFMLGISSFTFAQDNIVDMNFRGADIRDVLRTIAELADVNLIADGSVQGNITVKLNSISFNEALKLITSTHDLAYKWDGNTIVVATPEKIDEMYDHAQTTIINLNHFSATDMQRIITGMMPNLLMQTDSQNNRLIIRGNIDEIKEALATINKLDIPQDVAVETRNIRHADLSKIVVSINDIFPELRVQEDSNNNQLLIYGSESAVNEALELVDRLDVASTNQIVENIVLDYSDTSYVEERLSEVYPELRIMNDEVNRQLLISGDEQEVNSALAFVKRMDTKRDVTTEVVRVNYTDIEEIKKNLDIIAPGLVVTTNDSVGQYVISGAPNDVSLAVDLINQQEAQNRSTTVVVGIDYSDINEVSSVLENIYSDNLMVQMSASRDELILKGKQDIISDAQNLVKTIDTPERQVIIECRVEEVKGSVADSFGVASDNLSQLILIGEDYPRELDLSFPKFLEYIQDESNSTTLANPRLMAVSGEEASLLIGDKIPIVVAQQGDEDTQTSIEYIEYGTNLEFRPVINSDNTISIDIVNSVSSLGDTRVDGIPAVDTREAETHVRLKDGETMAIGGLIRENEREAVSKIPLLGDIPILGNLFKKTEIEAEKTELIIFITPHIVSDFDDVKFKEVKSEITLNEPQDVVEEVEDNYSDEKDIQYQEEKIESNEAKNTNAEAVEESSDEIKGLSEEELNDILGFMNNTVEDGDAVVEAAEEDYAVVDNKEDSIVDNKDVLAENTEKYDMEIPEREYTEEEYYLADYTVRVDDNLEDIADLFGVDAVDIIAANSIKSLKEGMEIIVPVSWKNTYRFKAGDTLWQVRSRFNVDIDRIKKMNNINDESDISIGTIIILPGNMGA